MDTTVTLAPYRFTPASVAGSDREALEDFFTEQAYYPSRSIRDMVDELDGIEWLGAEVELPRTYGDPAFRALERLARRVVRECRD